VIIQEAKVTTYIKTRLRSKGQVTVPSEVRELLRVNEGDDLIWSVDESGRVIVEQAKVIPPDQAWFWTDRWQKFEREVQADFDAGRIRHYANVDELLSDLETVENAGD
jgi:AbrB family looped-hinge helix DNA binding protein